MESSYNSNSHLHDREDREEYGRHETEEIDREISLGTSTILGIFFGLALVCALFFGFGYTMGRHSVPVAVAVESNSPGPVSSTPKPTSASQMPARESSEPEPEPTVIKAVSAEKPIVKPVAVAAPVATATIPATVAPTSQATGTFIVQIAAVSHREDADILLTTLGRRGYNVTIRQEPQDKLLHVVVGSFPNRKDADAMRLRLLADGYNAIVK